MENKKIYKNSSHTDTQNLKEGPSPARDEVLEDRPRVDLSWRRLLESGAHFGHKTYEWDPKTLPYLYGIHNQTHVINLTLTLEKWEEVKELVFKIVSEGGKILFIGTKYQASKVVKEEAERCGQPYVVKKWKGGTLTNFNTFRKVIENVKKIENILSNEELADNYIKKERLNMQRRVDRKNELFSGIKDMPSLPQAVFVIDSKLEHVAVSEARRVGIPVIALLDSNCDPRVIDYPIPGNDDANKSINLFVQAMSDLVIDATEAAGMIDEDLLDVEDLESDYDKFEKEKEPKNRVRKDHKVRPNKSKENRDKLKVEVKKKSKNLI